MLFVTDRTYNIWRLPIACLVLLAALLLVIYSLGRTARKEAIARQVSVVSYASDTFHLWKKLGVRGRILWYFDRNLSLDPIPEKQVRAFLADPETNKSMVNDSNFLYLALRSNIVRKIIFVVPDSKWDEYVAVIRKNPEQYPYGDGFVEYLDGVPVISINAGRLQQESAEKVLIFLPQAARILFGDAFLDRTIADTRLADVVVLKQQEP